MITDFGLIFWTTLATGGCSGLALWVAHHELKKIKANVATGFALGLTTCLLATTVTFKVAGIERANWLLAYAWVLGVASAMIFGLLNLLGWWPAKRWHNIASYSAGSTFYLPLTSWIFANQITESADRVLAIGTIWAIFGITGSIVFLFYGLDYLTSLYTEKRAAENGYRNHDFTDLG